MARILVTTLKTSLVNVRIYKLPEGYIAEINSSIQLGSVCFDYQACEEMVRAWVDAPLCIRGVMVDKIAA